MNINEIMKARELWTQFTENHPKFPQFISAVKSMGIEEGSVLEFSVTSPEGKKLETNLKIQASDLELIELAKAFGGGRE